MPAGDPAAGGTDRPLVLAEAHDLAAAARAAARHPERPGGSAHTLATLAALTDAGHHLLTGRRWSGARASDVDVVVAGPSGVFVIGTFDWPDALVGVDAVHRGSVDVTDELMTLADVAYRLEDALADVGLAPGEVHAVAVLAGQADLVARVGPVLVVGDRDVLRQVARRGARLGPEVVEQVLARCLEVSHEVPADVPVLPAPRGPVTPDADGAAPPVVPTPAAPAEPVASLLSPAETQQALLEGLMAAPVDTWMSVLDPAQAHAVRRSFNGPSRIRGAVGTGKTVVALHRAAYLARARHGRVLYTTYNPTLPDVLRSQVARLAPHVVDRVELAGVHETATRVLEERGVEVRIEGRHIAAAWTAAWGRVAGGSVIDTDRHEQDYWHDEVAYVIKGRGLRRFEEYAQLPRLGRRHRLGMPERRVVWDLYEAYQRELDDRGVHDLADQITLAVAALHRQPPRERYTAVVVDEVQDLTAMMIRMLHALVGDVPDGLTLVGDGQQGIYPGGFTLAEAGVGVGGRGTVLEVDHRNTREILQFASVLVQGDDVVDVEGGVVPGDLPTDVPRRGPKPVYVRCQNEEDRQRRMVQRVHEVVGEIGTNFGDVAVLSLSRRGVETALESLKKAGVPAVGLEQFDGVPVNRVKVGTVKRAKGLEFKQVLVVDLDASWITEKADGLDDAQRERRQQRNRELYVAITRARDGLWVASV